MSINIDDVVKSECNTNDPHDKIYEKELRRIYKHYKDITDIEEIKHALSIAREDYGNSMGTHTDTARCIILYKLLESRINKL